MSSSFDPYKILGIKPGASQDEIRRAYRRQAAKYHPDAGGDAWVFQQVQKAYELLSLPSSEPHAATRGDPDVEVERPTVWAQHRAEQFAEPAGSREFSIETQKDSTKPDMASTVEVNLLQQWLFGKPLKLHNETSYFVFANFMDLVMTGILLRNDAMEVNPIADMIYQFFGFWGLVAFKVAIVLLVCMIAQWIAGRHMATARVLLIGGTLVVAAVVVYSMWLAIYFLR